MGDVNITATPGMEPVTTVNSGWQNGQTQGESTGTEGIQQSPEALAAEMQQQGAAANLAGAEQAVIPATAAAVEGKAAGGDLKLAELQAQNAERQKLIADRMPRVQAAQAKAKEAEDSFANHKFYDYLESRSTGDKILSRLAIGLNAGANAWLGIPGNELANELQHKVDLDFEKQKVALHGKEQLARWRKEGVTDLYGQLQNELANLDVKHGKALEATAAKAESMALRAGIPEAEAKQNVVVARLQEAAAGKKLEAAQRYEKHEAIREEKGKSTAKSGGKQVTSQAAGKAPTESAAKTADLSSAMLEELDTIKKNPPLTQDELAKVQYSELASNAANGAKSVAGTAVAEGARKLGLVPRTKYEGLSPEAQKSMNAWDSLVESRARQLTGAGMPEQEAIREARTLGFSPGDTPALMQQKIARLRAAATRGMALSGSAGTIARNAEVGKGDTGTATPSQAEGKVVPIKSGPHAGKMARLKENGKYELIEGSGK